MTPHVGCLRARKNPGPFSAPDNGERRKEPDIFNKIFFYKTNLNPIDSVC